MNTIVEKLAEAYIKANWRIQNFCNNNTDRYLKETYGMEYYKLTVALTDVDDDGIIVEVVHKLVYISVEDCSSSYFGLRVLPDVVNPIGGKWKYAHGILNIYFPYIIRPDEEMENNCGGEITNKVFTVPKSDDDTNFEDVNVGFGNETFSKNLKIFLAH